MGTAVDRLSTSTSPPSSSLTSGSKLDLESATYGVRRKAHEGGKAGTPGFRASYPCPGSQGHCT